MYMCVIWPCHSTLFGYRLYIAWFRLCLLLCSAHIFESHAHSASCLFGMLIRLRKMLTFPHATREIHPPHCPVRAANCMAGTKPVKRFPDLVTGKLNRFASSVWGGSVFHCVGVSRHRWNSFYRFCMCSGCGYRKRVNKSDFSLSLGLICAERFVSFFVG